jgi:hypothetical protein
MNTNPNTVKGSFFGTKTGNATNYSNMNPGQLERNVISPFFEI